MNAENDPGLQIKFPHSSRRAWFGAGSVVLILLLAVFPARAQTCLSPSDMEAAARSVLETTAKRYFDMAAGGDVFSLKQNSIPSLASTFAGIEAAVVENKPAFAGAQATPRPAYLLQAGGAAPFAHAEFLCGVFGASGQTRNSAVFSLSNLQPGNYGLVILDVNGAKGPYTLTLVLQQAGNEWKLGGFYAKAAQAAGHDATWFENQARQFKTKGQLRNAWFYYQQARDLFVPVNFMSTLDTDKLYDESQGLQPGDLPANGGTVDLVADGKTYKLTSIFPLGVGGDFDLVVKYQAADVSNSSQTFQDNMAVIKALVARYPEYRDAFTGVVARAVEPSGRDYGSLLAMKEIK
jgi:hypothetical protein